MSWIVSLEGGPRRVNHAAVPIGDKIYSFGGFETGENYEIHRPIDVHILNAVTFRWSMVTFDESQHPVMPFQRYGHTVVSYGDCVYLWGGRNDEGGCNILYCFDTNTLKWSKPSIQGTVPYPRDGHSALVIENSMYIFGGYEEYGWFSQEVCALNLDTFTWTHIMTKGTPPTWRDFHTASAIGQHMYIFGGRGDRDGPYHSGAEVYCNQISYLDTKSMTWYQPEVSGFIPIGRRSHSAFVYNGSLYIFGGYNELTGHHFGEIYRYDPEACRWFRVRIRGKGPCPRRRQHCCLIGTKLYLFGGTSPRENLFSPPNLLAGVFNADLTNNHLMDHSDLHVLDFFPSLKTLCLILVIDNNLDQRNLPSDIRWEIAAMTTNNTISRPLTNAG